MKTSVKWNQKGPAGDAEVEHTKTIRQNVADSDENSRLGKVRKCEVDVCVKG